MLLIQAQQNVYNITYSQAVTHPSTNQARRCLTSVIGRELVLSTWYGRKRKLSSVTEYHSGNDLPLFVYRVEGRVLTRTQKNQPV